MEKLSLISIKLITEKIRIRRDLVVGPDRNKDLFGHLRFKSSADLKQNILVTQINRIHLH